MKKDIRIAIVDDQTLFREGFSELINNQEGISVELVAEDGVSLIEGLKVHEVDVVLIDYKMPGMNGLHTAKAVKEMNEKISVLILSMYNDRDLLVQAIESGACGFVNKDVTIQEMVKAIEDVTTQGYYADKKTTENLIKNFFSEGKLIETQSAFPDFTEMELEVIKLICKEHSTKEIAEKIYRGVRTVEGIRSNILKKIGAKNSNGIVIYAVKNGLIEV